VGIDSWAVDYGLLDSSGTLLGNPVHYRDARTDGVMEKVLAEIPAAEVYQITGLQFLPFNTLYQLAAAARTPQLTAACQLLMIPDLLSYWMTGVACTEVTNASTTQLLDVRTGTWSLPLLAAAGVPDGLFAPLRRPGEPAGELAPEVLAETGLAGPVPVTAVGSHDTASAVVGVPAADERFAYVSCGTWSLVGVELDAPVLTENSRLANFSNERGVDGTIRYLRNVMGLWLLQESLRAWHAAGLPSDLGTLLHAAARVPAFTAVIDAGDPRFLPPGDMPARIAEACRRTGQTPPQSRLSGRDVKVVHVVGGGARNTLLCQLTADACGVPVVAGPVEAAALGNVLVQARAARVVGGDLAAMRALLRATQNLVTYQPRGDVRPWRAAAARIGLATG
jgi:rhamnulokinase